MRLTTLILALAAAGVATPLMALESGDQFDQWAAQCSKNDKGEKNCHIFQNLVTGEGEDKQRILRVSVGYPDSKDQPVAVLQMPLGIWLPRGVTLAVDGGDPKQVPVQICTAGGCQTSIRLKESFVARLKAGRELKITMYNAQQKAFDIPVNLYGFSDGLAALNR